MNPMTRRNMVMAFAATAATAMVPVAFAQARDGGEYRILQARYGTAQRNVDVTQRLRELARRDANYRIENGTFGVDTDEGLQKTLRIFARAPNGQTQTFEYREGDTLDGSRFAGWSGGRWGDANYRGGWGEGQQSGGERGDDGRFRIQQALYGTSRRNVDVTERLREIARSDRSFRLTNDLFGVDPAEGRVKTLRIFARAPNGQTQTFEYREGDTLDGSRFTGWSGGRWGDSNYRGGWAGDGPRGDRGNRRDRDDDGQYRIQQALYGTSRRHVDVTERLRELARSDRSFRLTNDLFGTDPAEGRVKTLRIYARAPGGANKTFEYREGSVIDGSQFAGWGRGDWGQNGRRGGWGR